MKYDLSNEVQKSQAHTRFSNLKSKGKFIELREIMPKKTNIQNSYLHLILSWFAIEYGETLDYVKLEFYKKKVNRTDFLTEHVNKKTGELRKDWKSITEFDKKQTSLQITKFRNYSSKECNIYLPSANEHGWLKHIEIEIEKNKKYL